MKFSYAIPLLSLSILTACGGGSSSSTEPNTDEIDVPTQVLSISSSPSLTAVEDQLYQYIVTTNYSSELGFRVVSAPQGLTITDDGVIQWTPTEGVLDSGEVEIEVASGDEVVTQSFVINVTPVNDPPILEAVSNQQVDAGDTLNLQLNVIDPDDSSHTFTLVSGPEGMVVDSSGLVSYTSTATQSQQQQVTLNVADGGEDGAEPSSVSFQLSELYYYQLQGTVGNYYTNSPVAAGQVTISTNDQIIDTATLDQNGGFQLRVLDSLAADGMVLSSVAQGYSEASKRLSRSEFSQQHALLLAPVHVTETVIPSATTQIAVGGETAIVTLNPNSFVDENGEPVAENFTAEVFVIDPSADINLMPGEMITVQQDGTEVPIESFGAISAKFYDEQGNNLQLAEGQTAQIRIPATGINPPNTIPLYYYDNVAGVWVEEGEANLESNSEGAFYVGTVSHFTTWNADRVYETSYISGCVEDEAGQRLAGARISSAGRDYNGRSTAYSNQAGEFLIPVKKDSIVMLSAVFGFQSRTTIAQSYETDLVLESCLVLDESISTVKLKWGADPRDLDTHFYGPQENNSFFHIYFSNKNATVGTSYMYLDVDDTDSYGPEILTIPEFSLPGTYQYAVYQYSSYGEIQADETSVELILNGQRTMFTPPAGEPKRWWHVFEIVVSDEGVVNLVTVNEWSDFEPEQNYVMASARNKKAPSYQGVIKLLSEKYYVN